MALPAGRSGRVQPVGSLPRAALHRAFEGRLLKSTGPHPDSVERRREHCGGLPRPRFPPTPHCPVQIVARETPSTTAVEARSLGKHFGRRWALAHLDVRVRQGEAFLLAGSNGSGKTTLLRLIAGLYKPSRGELEVFGLRPTKERLENRRNLSLVTHHGYLYDRLTALEILRIWARLQGTRRADGDLVDLLGTVGLEDRRDHVIGGFSAGMRKRLTLLRARIEEPRLVLLDEPFAALDPEGQDLVTSWIREFRSEGKTVIMASHNLPRASRVCDRALILEEGQISWRGTGDDLARTLETGA